MGNKTSSWGKSAWETDPDYDSVSTCSCFVRRKPSKKYLEYLKYESRMQRTSDEPDNDYMWWPKLTSYTQCIGTQEGYQQFVQDKVTNYSQGPTDQHQLGRQHKQSLEDSSSGVDI